MMSDQQDNQEKEHVAGLLAVAHAMVDYTDTVAGMIAFRLGLDPSDEAITDAIWNTSDIKEALKILLGPTGGGEGGK